MEQMNTVVDLSVKITVCELAGILKFMIWLYLYTTLQIMNVKLLIKKANHKMMPH